MSTLNGRVLLLNFSYEPLGTVGVARAMCLVIRGVVSVEEFDGARVLRSPRAQAGRSVPENLATACVECNTRKGNRTPEEARMPLLTPQSALGVGLETVVLCHYAESRPEWRKYLYGPSEAAAPGVGERRRA